MRMLLIHTCGVEGSVAVADTDQPVPVLATVLLPPRTFSEGLMPALRRLLTDVSWTVNDLQAIGVVNGPGSFTGVRTGLSVGKGLSDALDLPLVGVSRLALLAAVAGGSVIHAVLDAGRNEFYYGHYVEGSREREALVSQEDLLALLHGPGKIVTCEEKVAASLANLPVRLLPEPLAGQALELATAQLADTRDDRAVDANYLRRTDNEIFAKPIVGKVSG